MALAGHARSKGSREGPYFFFELLRAPGVPGWRLHHCCLRSFPRVFICSALSSTRTLTVACRTARIVQEDLIEILNSTTGEVVLCFYQRRL